jgi:hypothetical protein
VSEDKADKAEEKKAPRSKATEEKAASVEETPRADEAVDTDSRAAEAKDDAPTVDEAGVPAAKDQDLPFLLPEQQAELDERDADKGDEKK